MNEERHIRTCANESDIVASTGLHKIFTEISSLENELMCEAKEKNYIWWSGCNRAHAEYCGNGFLSVLVRVDVFS